MAHGRAPNRRATATVLDGLIRAELVPWAPWVPEPGVCAELLAELSPAERQVLELLAGGHTPKQIARVRGVTAKTVANQMRSAMRRLEVTSSSHVLIVLNRAKAAAA